MEDVGDAVDMGNEELEGDINDLDQKASDQEDGDVVC